MNPANLDITKPGELTLILSDGKNLFVASPADPLSPSAPEALGVAGVDYLLSQLHMDRQKQRARTLVLLLAAEQTPPNDEQLTIALHRQIEFRMHDQKRDLANTYRYGWRVAGVALVILALCITFSSVFASEMTENMRPLIRKTFEYGFEIIGWVILWHPVDVLVFSPLAVRYRIAALRTLANVQVVTRRYQGGSA